MAQIVEILPDERRSPVSYTTKAMGADVPVAQW